MVTEKIKYFFLSPAFIAYGCIWISSVAYLSYCNRPEPILNSLPPIAIYILCIYFSFKCSDASSLNNLVITKSQKHIYLQLFFLLFIICLTTFDSLIFHKVIDSSLNIPVWSSLNHLVFNLGRDTIGNGSYFWTPFKYILLPLVILLFMNVKSSDLGLSRGQDVLRTTIIWCTIPVLLLIGGMAFGRFTLMQLIRTFISHFLQNGFSEEFLWRGAIQTRLTMIVSPQTAIVSQGILFGLWHFGFGMYLTNYEGAGIAIAHTLLNQAFMGIALGFVFHNTKSLIVCTELHILWNSLEMLG
jgi:membrane protease YdiL (CAAX protease family)